MLSYPKVRSNHQRVVEGSWTVLLTSIVLMVFTIGVLVLNYRYGVSLWWVVLLIPMFILGFGLSDYFDKDVPDGYLLYHGFMFK